jgi:hypothetical protein
MAIDYTTTAAVKTYGAIQTAGDDTLIGQMVTAFSRKIDEFCNQAFSQETYTDERVKRVIVDRAGMLHLYFPAPVISSITAASYRVLPSSNWLALTTSQLDVENKKSGSIVRYLDHDFSAYRNKEMQVKISGVAGWANLAAVPGDFEMTMRRLVFWAYKQREAPINKSAIPSLGQIVYPAQIWPGDIKDAFSHYFWTVV